MQSLTIPQRQVLQGDCLEIMRSFPSKCISVILTSPPFKDEDVNRPYYEFYDEFMAEVERITINAAFIFNTASRTQEILRRYDNWYHTLIWNKNLATQARRYQPIFLYKYPSAEFNIGAYLYKDHFTCRPVSDKDGSKVHVYQDPLYIYESLIKLLKRTKDDGIILDPFLGSGTTAIACEKLGRRWLGIELDPVNCAIAKKRIETWVNQGRLTSYCSRNVVEKESEA